MSLDRALDISVSAINAQRAHMEVIASNLANISSTRTVQGKEPYRRKISVFAENPLSFSAELARAESQIRSGQARFKGGGVRVAEVAEDPTPLQKIYNPGHPDADEEGFVTLPNVSLSKEMVDLVYTSKLYEANITAFTATKKMQQDTLQIP